MVSSGYYFTNTDRLLPTLVKVFCFFAVKVLLFFLHLHATTQFVFTGPLFFCLFFLCPLTAQNVRGLVGGLPNERNPYMCAKKMNYYLHDYSAKFSRPLKRIHMTIMRKYRWPFYNIHEHSAKFTWHDPDVPRPIVYMTVLQNLHDHYAKYRWPFYEICMTTLQIHTSILQNSHDITQTCDQTNY